MSYLIYILNLIFYGDIVFQVLMYFSQNRIPDMVDFGIIIVLGILLLRIDVEQSLEKKKL